jgi:hypothetical protein
MTQDSLKLKQVDARLKQMRGIAMAQGMTGNLFFKPNARTTAAIVT